MTAAKKRRPRVSPTITREWRALLGCVPGYDPFRDAQGCTFDAESASRSIDFFHELLTHVKGEWAGKPLKLERWQQAILANLFGWKRADGTRRYREAFIYVPRKNGKTAFVAGLANYLLFCDGEPGAEIYSAAADKDQAALCFDMAKGMVLQQPELAKRATVFRRAIEYGRLGSIYKVISADANTKHGFNGHGVIVDELHAQPDRELVDVLITSTGARRQPLVFAITTADYARPSICNEKLDYARKVRDGVVRDAAFLPVIYEALAADDWTSPAVWEKANPNLGVSVKREYLEEQCRKARELPSYENTFKRLHLNIVTEQADRWLALEKWDACGGALDVAALEGRACWCGLDLASTTDIAAFVAVFPSDHESDTERMLEVVAHFWIPEEGARARERRDRVPYLTWAREGLVTLTPGNVIDYDAIRLWVTAFGERHKIEEVAIDRWNATQITTQLGGDGIEMVPFGQGFHDMATPTKGLEKYILGRQVRHGGNPVLRWMASNVAVEQDAAGNFKPSKKRSTEKIDGIVALIMGIGRILARDLAAGRSVYDERGIETV